MPGAPQSRQFNPYSENGGTILAIAGADFSVIAGDTRQSEGYSIQTRYAPKVFRLYVFCLLHLESQITYLLGDGIRTDRAVLAVNGFAADGKMFVKSVKQRLEVPHILLYLSVLFAKCINLVVSTCSREGHASSRDRTTDTNNVVRKEILPLLCL